MHVTDCGALALATARRTQATCLPPPRWRAATKPLGDGNRLAARAEHHLEDARRRRWAGASTVRCAPESWRSVTSIQCAECARRALTHGSLAELVERALTPQPRPEATRDSCDRFAP